jgi:hypothetical protein
MTRRSAHERETIKPVTTGVQSGDAPSVGGGAVDQRPVERHLAETDTNRSRTVIRVTNLCLIPTGDGRNIPKSSPDDRQAELNIPKSNPDDGADGRTILKSNPDDGADGRNIPKTNSGQTGDEVQSSSDAEPEEQSSSEDQADADQFCAGRGNTPAEREGNDTEVDGRPGDGEDFFPMPIQVRK